MIKRADRVKFYIFNYCPYLLIAALLLTSYFVQSSDSPAQGEIALVSRITKRPKEAI